MRLKLNLWLGFILATVAFLLGLHSGPPFAESIDLVDQEVIAKTEVLSRRFPNFLPAVGAIVAMGMLSITGTLWCFVWYALKLWSEHKNPHEIADYDMGTPGGVNILISVLVMAAFLCGLLSTFLEASLIAVLLGVAALPNVLQLIDLSFKRKMGGRRGSKPVG